MPSSPERARRLAQQRRRRIELMQTMCRFYSWSPDEYKRLTVEELDVFVEKANEEIRERKRQAKRRR